jgi:type III secretion protein Q
VARTTGPLRHGDNPRAGLGTVRESLVDVTLPFDLPAISSGSALLAPQVFDAGRRAAREASRALASLTMGEASVVGRPLPCVPTPIAGAARLRVELTALPGAAALEVDTRLVVGLLDLLCGGPGVAEPAAALTPLEHSALELAVLAVLDAVSADHLIETRLAPRLARSACELPGALAVDLAIALGPLSGRARLLLPAAALRALREGSPAATTSSHLELELSLRSGAARLLPEELASLEPDDVVLLEPRPPNHLSAVAPGGLCIAGTERDGALHVEEIRMPDTSSEYPIALEVELARVPVTLGDLAALEPGSVLPLPIDRRGLVTLKLGDRTIARGQLVDVDGAVGVRIASLAGGRP